MSPESHVSEARRASLLLLLLLLARSAAAAELAGVTMPDVVSVAKWRLVLNGLGLREATIFRIDVYVAGLYLPERTHDPDAILREPGPKRLMMRMVRNVRRSYIAKAWSEGIRKGAEQDYPALEERVSRLNTYVTDLKVGDTVTLTQRPGEGIILEINGATLTTIPGDDFARALWQIWLGHRPPNAGLKRGLLGLP